MAPPDDFSANIGEDEYLEGPFAMIEETMIGQEDVLLVILCSSKGVFRCGPGWHRSLSSRG